MMMNLIGKRSARNFARIIGNFNSNLWVKISWNFIYKSFFSANSQLHQRVNSSSTAFHFLPPGTLIPSARWFRTLIGFQGP
jgi:hypothetical protein